MRGRPGERMLLIYVIGGLVLLLLVSSIKIISQYEEGVVLTLGRYAGTRKAGLRLIVPLVQVLIRVDIRVRTLDIDKQQVMTKDNVPVNINGVVFFKVLKAHDAVIEVQDYQYAIAQYAQTALRDVVGGMTLDTVLVERQKIGEEIRAIVDKETDKWGLDVQV